MQQRAALMGGAECQVQLQDPDSGYRHYGCFKTWDEALSKLARLKGNR